MAVALVRIDDRLVHAQVIEGWLKEVAADHIVVVSDEVAGDEIQKAMYSFAVPYGIKISCFSLKDAARHLADMISRGTDNLMILMPSFAEAAALLESGIKFKSVNVGGLHARQGKKFYTPTISVDEKDMEYARLLDAAGTELETRVLPLNPKKNFFEVIKGS